MKQSVNAITKKGLTGAVALAGASQAYAAVVNVTVPTNITGQAMTSGSIKEYWDIDTGTTASTNVPGSDLEFGYFNSASGPNEFFTGVYGLNGASTLAYYVSSNSAYAYPLKVGTVVGTGGPYAFRQNAGYFTLMALTYNGNSYGFGTENKPFYLGFQFKANDGLLHDGWLELESDTYVDATHPGGLQFIAGAYNTTADSAGGTILVGQTAVPEPGTLASLAVGAAMLAGVGLKRRRTRMAAQP